MKKTKNKNKNKNKKQKQNQKPKTKTKNKTKQNKTKQNKTKNKTKTRKKKNQQITYFFHNSPPWGISRRRPSDTAEGDTVRGLGPQLGPVSKTMGNAQHRTTQI